MLKLTSSLTSVLLRLGAELLEMLSIKSGNVYLNNKDLGQNLD